VQGSCKVCGTFSYHLFKEGTVADCSNNLLGNDTSPKFVTLVMPHGWSDLYDQGNLQLLESEVIPAFISHQRWSGAKDHRVKAASVRARGEIAGLPQDGMGSRDISEIYLAQVIDAELVGGGRRSYFLPLAAIWSLAETQLQHGSPPVVLAKLRQFDREGTLVDAFSQDNFLLAIMEALRREATIPLGNGEIRCRRTPSFERVPVPQQFVLRKIRVEQSNSSVFFEGYAMLKIYRRIQSGPHPEIEMSRYLVERAGFKNTPPLLAFMELADESEHGLEARALGVLFGLLPNQGDGWTEALKHLTGYLRHALPSPPEKVAELLDQDIFLALTAQLGIRTAEMHRALVDYASAPDFMPEPITSADIVQWRNEIQSATTDMLSRLERELPSFSPLTRDLAERLFVLHDRLFKYIRRLLPDDVQSQKTRFHGDFHLGQVLLVHNDFFIIDFEGEPERPLAARRRKSSPLRDVAGMIRSFDYAAMVGVRQLAEEQPATAPRMMDLAQAWRERAVNNFIGAYQQTICGCAANPADPQQTHAMIDFFTLEKAVYEVGYELANRPSWVDIPLNAILHILTKPSDDTTVD
jgi:maltose alpha-D-glucosyltransferase/alpha-amylase